jgi:hypothetical protein
MKQTDSTRNHEATANLAFDIDNSTSVGVPAHTNLARIRAHELKWGTARLM